MAKDDEKKEEAAEAKGGSKKMIVLVVPVLLLVVGAGYFLFLKPKGGAAEPAALPAPKPGAVVALTETTVNLADSHYLKFNMTLQPTASAKEVDGSKAATPPRSS
jgi:flagellar FliL protein